MNTPCAPTHENGWTPNPARKPAAIVRDRARVGLLALMGMCAWNCHGHHRLGPVEGYSLAVGPGSGTIEFTEPMARGALFTILHFGSTLEPGETLEVDLGYTDEHGARMVDRFTSESGGDFWTRPIRGGAPIRITYDNMADRFWLVEFGYALPFVPGTGGTLSNGDVFLINSPYVNPPPLCGTCVFGGSASWENVAVLDESDPQERVMKEAARATGMFVAAHYDADARMRVLSSCSAALVGPDTILTAAHCMPSTLEWQSGSFTLDYQTDPSDRRVDPHRPRFYKLRGLIKSGRQSRIDGVRPSTLDYAFVQIDTSEAGIPPDVVPRRFKPLDESSGLPLIGDPVFAVHHPRGATKKISRYRPELPDADRCYVLSVSGSRILFEGDLDHGSSGSPLYDLAGRIIGVNTNPGNEAVSAASIQQDLLNEAAPVQDSDVMIVLDHSGSMGLLGRSGRTKMEEAHDAAQLFVDLLDPDAGHRVGLVSFNSLENLELGLTPVGAAHSGLVGPGGLIAGLSASGLTTIGGGLGRAQEQFPEPGPGVNSPTILLMTDGMENTMPWVRDVDLGDTKICALGFGTEASLDGALLTRLAQSHAGQYHRAHDGLALQKFFALCFGNIFRNGASVDPFFDFPPGSNRPDRPFFFDLCGETELTVVLGWDRPHAEITASLVTPTGTILTPSSPGVVSSFGPTWLFLRIPLPFDGEQAGRWEVRAERLENPNHSDRFYITTLIDGGPRFRALPSPRRVYTGDPFTPQVGLWGRDGYLIPAEVTLTVERPGLSLGSLLSSGLLPPRVEDGDPLDSRITTLQHWESLWGRLPTRNDTYPLFDDGLHGDGAMEPDGIYGNVLHDLTRFEGTYTFTARARLHEPCEATREVSWSMHVALGIDGDTTEVHAQPAGTTQDGRDLTRLILTPRDRDALPLGPTHAGEFIVVPSEDAEIVEPIEDQGDGTYVVMVAWSHTLETIPDLWIEQPDRAPVLLTGLEKAVLDQGSKPLPPRLLMSPSDQTLTMAQTMVISVVATGTAPLSYQWMRDGEPLDDANGPVLVIPSVQESDAGDYSVWVFNEVGQVLSDPARMTVLATHQVFINEWLPSNLSGIVDEDGDPSGWIELYHAGSEELDLSGHYLTADPSEPTTWAFPKGTLMGPESFLVVVASAKNRPDHAAFKLNANGGTLQLRAPDGVTLLDAVTHGPMRPDVSQGRYPDGGPNVCYMRPPSPGAPNDCEESDQIQLWPPVWTPNGGLQLQWTGQAVLQGSPSLNPGTEWQDMNVQVEEEAGYHRVIIPTDPNQPAMYFRLRAGYEFNVPSPLYLWAP